MAAPLESESGSDHTVGGYYARRAQSYERVYAKPERQADLRLLEAMLPAWFVRRRVLEIACGTGWWTPHAARHAADWLATDLNSEPMAIAERKPMPACVRFQRLDAWTLAASDALQGACFDAAFAGFWWSHVAQNRLPAWLAQLHGHLQRDSCIVMLDNAFVEGSSTPLARTDADGDSWQLRTLDDGSTHEVMKNFPSEAQALQTVRAAAALGGRQVQQMHWHAVGDGHYWLLAYTLA